MRHLCSAIALFATGLSAQPSPKWRIADVPTLSLGAVTGPGPVAFGNVTSAFRQTTGTIVVVDGLELKFFSPRGEFLRSSGRAGAGPGEFRTIRSARLCGADSTFVYDPALMRLSVFSPDGEYRRAIDVRTWAPARPPYDIVCNRAGVFALVHRSPAPPEGVGPRRPQVTLALVDGKGPASDLGAIPASERYFDGSNDFPRPLGKITSIGVGTDVLFIGTGDAYAIDVRTHRGVARPSIREARPAEPVQKSHVDAFVAEQLERRARQPNLRELRELYHGIQYPKTFPAHGDLLVDDADNLWVEDYPKPDASQRRWAVFSKAGTPLAKVTLPAGFELLEVGAEYVLGRWRNDDGVVFVRQYQLLRQPPR